MGRKPSRATRNINWIEKHCRVPEGANVGQPIVLRPWQKRDLRKIYDNPRGTRRHIQSMSRKNGKTAMSSFLVLLHLAGPESVPNGQIYSAAQSREQASILFHLAKNCVVQSPTLSEVVSIRETARTLFCLGRGTSYKALSAEVKTSYGLSPVMIIHDELGQVRGPRSDLYDALETATGAQKNPLSIIISTQAPTDNDLLSILIDDALTGADKTTTVSLYTAPIDMDPFSEPAFRKANPAYGDFLQAKAVKEQAKSASRMPAREASFRNLILNQRVEARSPFISRSVWAENGGDIVEDFADYPIFAGLDLSETNDLTAFVPVALVDGQYHVKPTFWLPGDTLTEKAKADRVPYDMWHKQGFLEATPGKTIEYDYIAHYLLGFVENHDVRKIAFDRWNWRHLKPWLAKAGFSDEQLEGETAIFEEMGQGMQSMSPALRDLEGALLSNKVRHANHPVLSMCAANAVAKPDPAGNRKLYKNESSGRIDGMVAFAMALRVAATYTPVTIESCMDGGVFFT